ncbi:MAG: hypothetical protein C0594_00705 [Marinilabiliales bacterium]|nr:MAG: hypothetical protein C0594_00705 [Marinilabiliales bacterium]
MLKHFLIVLLLFVVLDVSSQIPVGEWRDHLPYVHGRRVATSDSKIYCATGEAIFSFNKLDNSIEKLSKANVLTDIGVSAISYSSDYSTLIIGYTNGNLDLIDSKNNIQNIADIKRKQISASKTINNIYCSGKYAYLSMGFGIVVLDIERREIYDTYYIGEAGTYKYIYELDSDGEYFYAATESGIYKADLNSPNLANYVYWNRITNIPNYNKAFNALTVVDDEVWFNFNSLSVIDTLYYMDDNGWYYADTADCIGLSSGNGVAMSATWWKVTRFTDEGKDVVSYSNSRPEDALYDSNGDLWIADMNNGLIRWTPQREAYYYVPNGPFSDEVTDMDIQGGRLFVAAGARDQTWNNSWNTSEVNIFENETWSYARNFASDIVDVVSVVVNPEDPNQVFAGSWNGGLLEFSGSELKTVYRSDNSTLRSLDADVHYKIGSLAFDEDNNLWVTNSGVSNPVSVRMSDGSWETLEIGDEFNNGLIGDIIITPDNNKWLMLPRGGGIFVFNENGTFDNYDDDQYKVMSVKDEYNELITNDIYSLAVDKEGYVWVGTNQGVVVYYNPENVFSGENFYASHIIVDMDGTAQYLLETEVITDIVVDGSNKKWFATENAGVFLMSEDGTEQILNFNIENSPLLSNTVNSIAIDGDSGEVFFGTDKGVISYKGIATEGKDGYKDVYVYPNPIRPGYTGKITVTNLVTNSSVKITDISGNLVYETKAEGGQAVWDGNNFDGRRVRSGIYLVFCTNEDGSKTHVAKFMLIN